MRFRPTLYAAILGSSLAGASLFLMAAGDEHPPAPANPEYQQWSHFKPGSFVTLEQKVLEHREDNPGVVEAMARPAGAAVTRITSKLVDLDKDKAVLEETRIDLGEGSETEMPADKVTLFASGEIGDATDSLLERPAKQEDIKATEGDEDMVVHGNKIKAHWVETSVKTGPELSTAKDWLSDEIPGGLIKEEVKKTIGGKLVVDSVTKVIDYKSGS